MTAETEQKQDFRLELAQQVFLYKATDVPGTDKAALQQQILATIFEHGLAPYCEHLCAELGWAPDAAKAAAMADANAARLAELEQQIADAEENLGETEVRDALLAKAAFLGKVGDRPAAAAAYAKAEEKTASSGAKADMVFAQTRLAILYHDWHAVKQLLAKARGVCDAGGDWEHKNRLKVYEGVAALHARDFARAADLLLDSTATFTTTELFDYARVVAYAVVAALVSLGRVDLKRRVVDSPEIRAAIGHYPSLETFLHALYDCDYAAFFRALPEVSALVRGDMYAHPHARHYMREVRLVAYNQFLESYKSVTLDSMAAAFGVSAPFLDEEVAEFICAGRISAKIDRVAGVVETRRPDAKNARYQEAIRRGDLLLNRVQKLSRVIDVE